MQGYKYSPLVPLSWQAQAGDFLAKKRILVSVVIAVICLTALIHVILVHTSSSGSTSRAINVALGLSESEDQDLVNGQIKTACPLAPGQSPTDFDPEPQRACQGPLCAPGPPSLNTHQPDALIQLRFHLLVVEVTPFDHDSHSHPEPLEHRYAPHIPHHTYDKPSAKQPDVMETIATLDYQNYDVVLITAEKDHGPNSPAEYQNAFGLREITVVRSNYVGVPGIKAGLRSIKDRVGARGENGVSPNDVILVLDRSLPLSRTALTHLNARFLLGKGWIAVDSETGVFAFTAHLAQAVLHSSPTIVLSRVPHDRKVLYPRPIFAPDSSENKPASQLEQESTRLGLFSAVVSDNFFVKNVPLSPVMNLNAANTIHVVMCTHSRPKQLPRLLSELVSQDIMVSHKLHLSICNNNPEHEEEYITHLERIEQSKSRFSFTLTTFHKNVKGYGRFLLANELWDTRKVDHVIFVDDDVTLGRAALRQLWTGRKVLGVVSTYCKQFGGKGQELTYWKTPMHLWSCGLRPESETVPVHYAGTGFAIADSAVIKLVPQVMQIPLEYFSVEDMWLSYVVAANEGDVHWLPKVDVMFNAVTDEEMKVAQWKPLKPVKQEMLTELQNQCGFGKVWPANNEEVVSRYCGGNRKQCDKTGCEEKLEAFKDMQRRELGLPDTTSPDNPPTVSDITPRPYHTAPNRRRDSTSSQARIDRLQKLAAAKPKRSAQSGQNGQDEKKRGIAAWKQFADMG